MSEEAEYSADYVSTVASEAIEADLGLEYSAGAGQVAVGMNRAFALGEALCEAIRVLTRDIPVPEDTIPLGLQPVVQDLVRASALRATLDSDRRFDLLGRVVRLETAPEQKKALETLSVAQAALEAGNLRDLRNSKEAIHAAFETLSQAARGAHRRLQASEQRVLGKIAERSLENLGYGLALKRRPDGLLVRGYKQDLSMAVQVSPDGRIVIDTAGFGGNSCAAEVQKLEAAMAERGVKLTVKRRSTHGRAEGGSLIQACKRETGWTFDPLGGFCPSRRRARKAAAHKMQQQA